MSLNLPDPNRAVGDSGHTSDTNLIASYPSVRFPVFNVENCHPTNTVVVSNFESGTGVVSDCINLVNGKSSVSGPSFCGHISHVFGLGSLPKMVWVYAGWYVAFVKHFHSVIDWFHKGAIHPSVDKFALSVGSVSLMIFGAHPKPASIGNHYLGKDVIVGGFVPWCDFAFKNHGSMLTRWRQAIKWERRLACL